MNDSLHPFRPIPFFFLNTDDPEDLSLSAARGLLRRMKDSGYGGALLFNKPPTGFDQEKYLTDAWYDALENFCIAARENDLKIWINDGWNYPPGEAGGRIMAEDPALIQYRLQKMEDGSIKPVEVSWGFPAFEEPRSVELFHKFVYEGLSSRLGQYFSDPLVGIFSDADNRRINADVLEKLPSKIYFPWTVNLPDKFYAKYQYELLPHLNEIYELEDTQASADYWSLVSDLYHSWFAANHKWCHSHGLLYSFHTSDSGPMSSLMCRRTSVFSEGQTLKLARNCDYPGTDHELFALDGGTHFDSRIFVPEVTRGGTLERWKHPSFEKTMYDVRAKITSSAAYLHGKERALCEAFAATNYEASPEKLRRIACWQIMQGINFFVPHAVHVKFFGPTKFFAPPEFLRGYPEKALREFNDFIAEYSMIAARGQYRPQLALLDPTPQMWRKNDCGKFFEIFDKLNHLAIDYVITDQEHAKEFDLVIDPFAEEPLKDLPRPYAKFSGGELSYYRRFLPDGTSFFLAANMWSDKTLSGQLVTDEKTIDLELAPGEIAVIGGPWEEYRTPAAISSFLDLPENWSVQWDAPQRMGFIRSFEWENTDKITGLTLLVPGKGKAKLNGVLLENGKKDFVFDDVYTSYPLPDNPGRYYVEVTDEISFETPVYLSGDYEVQYGSKGDFHEQIYLFYNLKVFAPEKETIRLSARKSFLRTGSWTEQGHGFYSGKVTYAGELVTASAMDLLELAFEGSLCEVTIDGKYQGAKALSPYIFPLQKFAAGRHTIKITITNTLGNQLEQFRVPSGLIHGKLLKTAEKIQE